MQCCSACIDSLKLTCSTTTGYWCTFTTCTATSHADIGTGVVTSSNWIKYIKHKCSYVVLRVPKPMTNTSHPTAERATSGSISCWEKTRTLLSFLSKLIKWGYNFYLFSVGFRNHRSDGLLPGTGQTSNVCHNGCLKWVRYQAVCVVAKQQP